VVDEPKQHSAEKDAAVAAAIARVLTSHQYSRKTPCVGHCTCGHVSWSPLHQAEALLAAGVLPPAEGRTPGTVSSD